MKQLSKDTFDEATSEGKVIVDFWAEWCGPCKQLAPVYEDLSDEFDNIDFTKLDVEENQDVAAQNGVRGIPTRMFYEDGDEIGRAQGFMPKDALKKKITTTFS
jgi:thioredoxin 1